jgi:hypothetical protein
MGDLKATGDPLLRIPVIELKNSGRSITSLEEIDDSTVVRRNEATPRCFSVGDGTQGILSLYETI